MAPCLRCGGAEPKNGAKKYCSRACSYAALKRTPEERYWPKVDKRGPDECWLWTAFKDPLGYGKFDGKLASRYMWFLTHGVWPETSKFVCHHCDNPSCVNPAHLFLGTHQDNMTDMRLKGRGGYQRRTHCLNGHEFTEANTRWIASRNGHPARHCRQCECARSRAYTRRKAEALRSAAARAEASS